MTDRVVTKVFCGRNHRIGSVMADASGVRVEYQAVTTAVDGPIEFPTTWRPSNDSVEATEAWCRHCRKRYPLFLNQLASDGRRQVFLTAEGMWNDPIGVLERNQHSANE